MRTSPLKNYRFIIGAFAALMLVLLITSSNKATDFVSYQSDYETNLNYNQDIPLDSSAELPGNGQAVTANNGKSVPVREQPMNDAPVPAGQQAVNGAGAADPQMNTQPVQNEPGFINDQQTQNGNPDVNQAVQNQVGSAGTGPTSYQPIPNSCGKENKYVIMIDAGSTGSRIHIYEFDVCAKQPKLLRETFDEVKPGISNYIEEVDVAASSLVPLLNIAMKVIPESQRGCSPISVKATAGLKLLNPTVAKEITTSISNFLSTQYPFPVAKDGGVSIMDSSEEAAYTWVTANFLLGNIGYGTKIPTSAIFDLGSGSAQIVFEPTFPRRGKMAKGEHKYELTLGGQKYTLYQFSHLGYGLMEARKKINALVLKNFLNSKEGKSLHGSQHLTVPHPCITSQMHLVDQTVALSNGQTYHVDFIAMPGTLDSKYCKELADKVLNKEKICSKKPCSFNGVHQPSIDRTFNEFNDMYITSYFYDIISQLGMPSSFSLEELVELTDNVCQGPTRWNSVFSGFPSITYKLKSSSNLCMDLSYQTSLLQTGYDISLTRELKIARNISDSEINWCLGASLPLLDGKDWKCKVGQTA